MSAPSPSIRAATDDDGGAITRLIAGCFAEYEGCRFLAEEFPELARPASHYREHGGRLWVAETPDDAIVGSFAVFDTAQPGVFEIGKVYLAAASRGRGIAARLLAEATAFAAAAGATRLRLWTDTRFVDGHRFYERHGFRRIPALRHVADASVSWEYLYARDIDGSPR